MSRAFLEGVGGFRFGVIIPAAFDDAGGDDVNAAADAATDFRPPFLLGVSRLTTLVGVVISASFSLAFVVVVVVRGLLTGLGVNSV